MAGSPGIRERVLGYVMDNPLTRSWAQTMDRHVIGPVERRFLNDEDLARQVSKLVRERTPDNNVLSEQQLQAFDLLKGVPANRERLQQAVSAAADPRMNVGDQAYTVIGEYSTPRSRQGEVAAMLADGRTGLTDDGDVMRQFGLGSPVAAYAGVGGGALLGAHAVNELLQAQQRAQKESQLPLQQ